MSYKLIEGEIRLYYRSTRHVGSRPDGDSAWFKPDNPELLSNINGRSAKFNPGGFTQIRYEGIDALELHYQGPNHQLKDPTVAARDFLLNSVGFDPIKIEYKDDPDISNYVRHSVPIVTRAHILTRAIGPYKRPIAFVFAGNAPERSGSEIYLRPDKLDQSVNAALMREGHVYPAYYSAREINGRRTGGLPWDLRNHLTTLANQATGGNKGLWPDDRTTNNFVVNDINDLKNLAIWPKLYRRLFAFFKDPNANHTNLHGFIEWLQAETSSRDDLLLILSIGELLNISDVITVTDDTLNLDYSPHDIVLVPR